MKKLAIFLLLSIPILSFGQVVKFKAESFTSHTGKTVNCDLLITVDAENNKIIIYYPTPKTYYITKGESFDAYDSEGIHYNYFEFKCIDSEGEDLTITNAFIGDKEASFVLMYEKYNWSFYCKQL